MKIKIKSCSNLKTFIILTFSELNVFILKQTSILISSIFFGKICYVMEKVESKWNIISVALTCGK